MGSLTMMTIMPGLLSLLVKYAASIRMTMVTGIAPIVRPNSGSLVLMTMTRNWIVNPRKKKKSNLSKAM